MMSSITSRQQGGILAFVVVGAVLALLLAGGIYASKNMGRQAALNPMANTNPTPAVDTAKTDNNKPTEQTQTPSTTTPSTPATNPQSSTPRAATPTPNQVAATGPTTVPETGPTEFIATILGLAALTGGLSAYRRSVTRVRVAALK